MPTEHDTFNDELDDILDELGISDASDESSEALALLDAELAGTEFDAGASSDVMTMLGIEDDPEMQQLVLGIVARRARRLIQRLIDFARRHRNCARCVGLVTQAVALFKAKRYAQAIATGARAVQCFRTCRT